MRFPPPLLFVTCTLHSLTCQLLFLHSTPTHRSFSGSPCPWPPATSWQPAEPQRAPCSLCCWATQQAACPRVLRSCLSATVQGEAGKPGGAQLAGGPQLPAAQGAAITSPCTGVGGSRSHLPRASHWQAHVREAWTSIRQRG